MRAAIYSRKSKFTGKGDSIENQIHLCREYAARHFEIDQFIIYEDEGFSGANTNRPKFKELLADAKDNKFDYLICYRLDRISRNVADFSTTLELLERNRISFVSIKEQFDTSTPMGKAMVYIASVFAQLERETIAERIRDNMMELAKSGRWLGGQTPLGFDSKPIVYYDHEMKERKMYSLTPVSEELCIIKSIYEKYIESKSVTQVHKYLLTNCIKGKNGGNIGKSGIIDILSNPVYVKSSPVVVDYLRSNGISVTGNADNKKSFITYNKKRHGKTTPMDTWIAAVSSHDGIIDGREWVTIQNTIKSNKSKAPRLGKSNTALLTGIVKCGKCGSTMRIAYGRKNKETGKKTFYYTCSLKVESGKTRCDSTNFKGDDLEKTVFQKLKSVEMDCLLSELEKTRDSIISTLDTAEETKSIDKKIKHNETSIGNLVKQLSINSDSSASKYIMAEIEFLNKENETLQKSKEDSHKKSKHVQIDKKSMNLFFYCVLKLSNNFEELPYADKKACLSIVFDDIIVNDNGKVELNFWGHKKK